MTINNQETRNKIQTIFNTQIARINSRIGNWKLYLGLCLVLVSCILYLCSPAHALKGNQLIENTYQYDNKIIAFQGEVVGDIMIRSNSVWLNVNDKTRTIGVWGHKNLAQHLTIAGDYNHIGDEIKVIGQFHRACAVHGGDLDIHAHQIQLIKKGYKVSHPIDYSKLIFSGFLFLAILVVFFYPMVIK